MLWLWQVFAVFNLIAVTLASWSEVQKPIYDSQARTSEQPARVFTLRQIHHHGAHKFEGLHRYVNITAADQLQVQDEHGRVLQEAVSDLTVREDLMTVARSMPSSLHSASVQTQLVEVKAPNITDKQTILSFARMAANAYARKDNKSELPWQDVGSGYNYTNDFGWETDGLRGHVFADETNRTVVISLKGTSVPWLDDPDTTIRDLENDNLFASCCCGQGGSLTWKAVCHCKTGYSTCNSTCLTSALHTRRSYYWAAQELYYNVTRFYPGADVWMTGHSLGGVVSSLLGLTLGLPTITYEAFPDALAASRYDLPTPPDYGIGVPGKKAIHDTHIHHFGHTADPIFTGTCNGIFSSCSFWGYAMETRCHTGKRCVYDTVNDLKWGEDIHTHSIVRVIEEVLEVYDTVPSCERDTHCTDCESWNYIS